MFDQIGLNHILSFDTFCFCLLCKKCLSENGNLTQEDIISLHLGGEDHTSNCKALFKLCFPDPTCDSDDIKYVDILRNLAFDVSWDIGNEASYVSITDNNLRCLICQENISKMYKNREKLEMVLASHLKSEIHLNEVRNKASWIHHPFENTNYIAFQKSFVFCSYCQKYIKSPMNTLLKIAADHIKTDLNNLMQMKLKKEHTDSAVKDSCLLLESLKISDEIEDEQYSEISDLEIIEDFTHFSSLCSKLTELKDFTICGQREVLDKPIEEDKFLPSYHSCKPSGLISSTCSGSSMGLQIIGVENVTSKNLMKISNKDLMTELSNDSSLIKLNEQYIEVKDNRFLCKLCKIFIQIDVSGTSLKMHLRNNHNDLLVQLASDFIWKIKNGCCNSLTDQKEESEKFCSVRKKIAFDKKFMSHLNLIENNGRDFVCILCKEAITFSTCGKYVESHFFKTDHLKKMYEISIDIDLVKKQPDQSSKTNCKNKNSKKMSDKNVFDLFFNTNVLGPSPITNLDSPVTVVERRLLKVLRKTSEEKLEIKINLQFLTLKGENIFCEVCQSLIILNNSCYDFQVSKHCSSLNHIQILFKNTTDYLEANDFKPDRLEQAGSDLIVQRFYKLMNEVTESDKYNVTVSHFLFLIITITDTLPCLSCYLCHESVKFTVFGVMDHFFSNLHRSNIHKLVKSSKSNFKSLSDSSLKTPGVEQTDLQATIVPVSLIHNYEQPLEATLNYKGCLGQLKNNNQIPQEENAVQSALNKVLETAEHDLKEVIKNNLHYIELKNKRFVCVICKINIISLRKLSLQSLAVHFKGRKHKQLKLQHAFNKTSFEEKSSPNPVPQNENETSNSKHPDCSSSTLLLESILHKIPQKEFSLSAVQSAFNNVLETAEHVLKEIIENNLHYIDLKNISFVCIICKITIISKKKLIAADLKPFAMHFNGKKHRKLKQGFENTSFGVKSSPNTVSRNENETSKDKHTDSSSSTLILEGALHKIPQKEFSLSAVQSAFNNVLETAEHGLKEIIENNLHNIGLENKSVVCNICKITIISKKKLVAANLILFAVHFNSRKHLQLKKDLEKTSFEENNSPNLVSQKENDTSKDKHSDNSSSTALLEHSVHKISKKYPEVWLNKLLITLTKNNFFCNVCQEIFFISEDDSILKMHCLSERHNEILIKNALNYVSTLKHDHLLSFSEEDNITLYSTLKLIQSRKPFDTVSSDILLLIVKHQHLFCLLCRKQIQTSATGIFNHFMSYFHGFKVYTLNHFSNYSICTVREDQNPKDQDCEESNQNEEELLILILKSLPDDLKEFRNDIGLSKSTIYCRLCSYMFSLKRSLPNIVSTIQQHLTEHLCHENISTKIELLIGTENYASLSNINQLCIKSNIDLLEMRGSALFCCICKIELIKKKGTTFTRLNLLRWHFNSLDHRKRLLATKS